MNRSGRRWAWPVIAVGVLLWFMVVMLTYYAVHKPLTGTQAAALIDLIVNLTLLMCTLIVAAAWGRRIERWLGVDRDPTSGRQGTCEPGLEQWTLGTILGLGLLGTLILGLAAVVG